MSIQQNIVRRIRIFNKHGLNRLTRRLAYAPVGPFVLVRHVGRRSGKSYETPLMAVRTDDSFVLALTYGPNVDWYRNVQAAGHCELIQHGVTYRIADVEPLAAAAGRSAFPQPLRLVLRIVGTQHFVHMKETSAPA